MDRKQFAVRSKVFVPAIEVETGFCPPVAWGWPGPRYFENPTADVRIVDVTNDRLPDLITSSGCGDHWCVYENRFDEGVFGFFAGDFLDRTS